MVADWVYALLLGGAVGLLHSGLTLFTTAIRREWEGRVQALEARLGQAPSQLPR